MGSRAEPPAADAKGDQHGMEQHSGVRSSAVSAVVWSLPQLYLESGGLHPSGSLDKCLAHLMPGGEGAQEPIYRWSPSADTPVLIMWADIVAVSPCQMRLGQLR